MMTDSQPVSRRPKDTKFKQQKLPAWQPILTANTVLPLLFAIGIAFIPLGIGFLITANNVREKIIDYTTDACKSLEYDNGTTCDEVIKTNRGTVCSCKIQFRLDEDFPGPVMMYYSLTNYYQNHRRYVKSRDDKQLNGDNNEKYSSLSGDCWPYQGNQTSGYAYAPCGAIANSMFNDTLSIAFNPNNSSMPVQVPTINTGIAWQTDVNYKFKNPDIYSTSRNYSMPPPNWHKSVWELNGNETTNNGYQNEDFIVWMRTAALPTFRKLYRRIQPLDGEFSNGLPAGNYTLTIGYAYPVTDFGGTKRLILSTTSWLGGKNPFLGIAYIVVGSICFIMGCIFLVIHIRIGKRGKKARNIELTAMTPYYEPNVNSSQQFNAQ